MATTDRVRALAEPVCAAAEVELFDIELAGGILRITVDRPSGVDMELISALTRRISRLLDDDDPVPGRYTLEVSSPGLERRLRTPAHFRAVVGQVVNIRTHAGTGHGRRFKGPLLAADDEGITVGASDAPADAETSFTLAYDQIERARTVFEWGPAPKPGGPKQKRPSDEKKAAKP